MCLGAGDGARTYRGELNTRVCYTGTGNGKGTSSPNPGEKVTGA